MQERHLRYGLGWAQATMYYIGVQTAHGKGQRWGDDDGISEHAADGANDRQ